MTKQLTVGDTAPDFTLPNAQGEDVTLSQLRGRDVVVYFYPKAETPGCTTEACDFRDNLASLRGAGYEVIGISADPVEAIASFAKNHDLVFPLLSDAGASVSKEYGAWGEKVINGTAMVGVLRSTIVVDKAGVVSRAEYNVSAEGHVAALRQELGIDA
ncbi:thioredoxin-dependent thiol peroxidase [Microbacterium sp. MPKO10]|uniref:thioredoxin-dependent thiol peroxidase n=1 Tax=Microbacterium sp. MPKO10 TaxID=2989818 RepID=UPI002235EDFC|nr:thioredoxin-dependent thiol peroxidase [Microbacterium sp. MPKO10]MCW4458614.1 thioredoxin-dependent thiol peroxidase [Microbacterium sp. MPKO10]